MSFRLSNILGVRRISKFVEGLQDVRTVASSPWLARVPVQPAEDQEIMGRYTGLVSIADIVVDDGRAVVRPAPGLELVSTKVPNIKHGVSMSQEQLNTLDRITRSANPLPDDLDTVDVYLARVVSDVLKGVQARRDMLVAAMVTDNFTGYDSLGIKGKAISFGMPSDLKITLSGNRRWRTGNETTAKPITDLMDVINTAKDKYGKVYNRLTLSNKLLMFMATTDEFKNRAQLAFSPSLANVNLALLTEQDLGSIAGKMLGLTIEVNDASYRISAADGSESFQRYVPDDFAVLSTASDDGDKENFDFANAVPTEVLVGSIAGASSIVGSFGDLRGAARPRGPLAYATVPGELNPPNITIWGVQRGFPRRHSLAVTARIDCDGPS
jgi:hypothetical protein